MDYRCEFCGKITRSAAGLKRHITIKHRQPLAVDLENRLVALEQTSQGLRKAILALIDSVTKNFAGICKEMKADTEASFKRDNDIFERLKVIDRDWMKGDQDLHDIIEAMQKNEGAMLKVLDELGHHFKELRKSPDTEQTIKKVLEASIEK